MNGTAGTAVRRLIKILAFAFCALLALPYALTPVYRFPAPHPFSGSRWYNPYSDTSGIWLKANLHMHSDCWWGLTNGRQSAETLCRHYHAAGYTIIAISDYQAITIPQHHGRWFIPAYEHGYNIWKRHQLCIGANSVVWFDYPFGQNIHHKQAMLERLHGTAAIVAIAHPKFCNGYTPDDFTRLTAYDLIEVLNHFRISTKHWDAALSAGRAAFLLADDDTHDINDSVETGRCWTWIRADTLRAGDWQCALRAGNAFGVSGGGSRDKRMLRSVEVTDSTFSIMLDSVVKQFRFIGQNGALRAFVDNAQRAEYRLQPNDTYIRVEIETGGTTLYLNPVLRFDGVLQHAVARVNLPTSIAYWLLFTIGYSGLAYLLFGVKRRSSIR